MCGIAGFWSPGLAREERRTSLRAMTNAIAHRGPDADGEWFSECEPLALGHRRLAVIDLTATGAQPMTSASGRWVMVFNGEIYNFRALRTALSQCGATFRGSSDTEVLLCAVEQWGIEKALGATVGMFAFGLFDCHRRELHLARDRFGEKPLYFAHLGKGIGFASELKALWTHPEWKGDIDRNALAAFLRHTYVPAPLSIFTGVSKIIPGTFLTVAFKDDEWHASQTTYWSAASVFEAAARQPIRTDEKVMLDELESRLESAVSGQMIADVPIGAFLSGGIDSSLIVALMQQQSSQPVRTFTIGFREQAFDEARYARAVAAHLGTSHTDMYVSPQEARDVIPELPQMYDEPLGDSSQIPTYLVSRLARHDVTVALSGDGGDELFGGYARYDSAERIWQRLERVPFPLRRGFSRVLAALPSATWDSLLGGLAEVAPQRLRLHTPDKMNRVARFLSLETREEVYRFMSSAWDDPTSVVLNSQEFPTRFDAMVERKSLTGFREQMMLMDIVSYLPDDIMVKVDRASMCVSLETRAPLLDHRVFEYAASLPSSVRRRKNVNKWVLRQLLRRHLPSELIDRPKMGFAIPVGEWLRGPLRDWAEQLLSEQRLTAGGFFDPPKVRRVWLDHLTGRSSHTGHLWPILMFQAWLEARV